MTHPHAHFLIPIKPTFMPIIGTGFSWNHSVSCFHHAVFHVANKLDNDDTEMMFDPYYYQYTLRKRGKVELGIFFFQTEDSLVVELRRLWSRGHPFLYTNYYNKFVMALGEYTNRDLSSYLHLGFRRLPV